MLTLDLFNSDQTSQTSPALRAEREARLGALKRELSLYYGFTTSGSIAEALAYRQAVNDSRDASPDGTPPASSRSPTDPLAVQSAIRDLDIRGQPGVADVFSLLLETGEGSRKILGTDPSSVMQGLTDLLSPPQGGAPTNFKQTIQRCVQIHFSNNDVTVPTARDSGALNLSQEPSRIFFNDLDGALPSLSAGSNTANVQASQAASPERSSMRSRCAAVCMHHPLLVPGEKNAELLSVFFNSIPTLELTRATPVLNVTIYSSRQITEDGRLAAITLQKFVEGAKQAPEPTDQNIAERAFGLASQVTASLFGDTQQNFEKYSVIGMELFRAPQTLINPEGTKQRLNYLAPVIDPMRPLASVKSFEVDVKSTVGLMATKAGTLQLVLHDRSRMGEFADFVKPDRYGTSFIEVEYGWSHPDPLGVNPFADLLNLTRLKEHYNIITSTFSFDDVGQVNITLNCMGRGVSEVSELSILGEARGIRAQIARMEQLSKTINELSPRVFGNVDAVAEINGHRREIRGEQALVAAGDAVNNLIINEELFKQFQELRATVVARGTGGRADERQLANQLLQQLDELIGNPSSQRRTRNPTINGALGTLQRSINNDINELLSNINPLSANNRADRFNDAFLKNINSATWSLLTNSEGGSILNQHVDAISQENVSNQLTAGTAPSRAR